MKSDLITIRKNKFLKSMVQTKPYLRFEVKELLDQATVKEEPKQWIEHKDWPFGKKPKEPTQVELEVNKKIWEMAQEPKQDKHDPINRQWCWEGICDHKPKTEKPRTIEDHEREFHLDKEAKEWAKLGANMQYFSVNPPVSETEKPRLPKPFYGGATLEPNDLSEKINGIIEYLDYLEQQKEE